MTQDCRYISILSLFPWGIGVSGVFGTPQGLFGEQECFEIPELPLHV